MRLRPVLRLLFILHSAFVIGHSSFGADAPPATDAAPLPTGFFKKIQNGETATLVLYGTSLTHTAEWPKALDAWLQKAFPGRVTTVNAAQSGQHSNWGVANLETRVLSQKPDLVFIEFSVNDAATKHRISVEQSVANLDTMVRALRGQNPRMEIVVQTMNPAWDAPDEPNHKKYASDRPRLTDYYDACRTYTHQENLPLLDHYPNWEKLRKNDESAFRKWLPDGIHPIPEASVAVTLPAITALLEKARAAALPAPTLADVAYGEHERQKLDFYRAASPERRPTPVVVHLHGGGWTAGDKRDVAKTPFDRYLAAGISVVSINYRYVSRARSAGAKPPVSWPMLDAARAVQFVRSRAAEWNLDPARLGLTGTSAGACTNLWLAFHDDLADPASPDPVARQSTRPFCVAADSAQTSLDPAQMKEWTPNSRYGGHAFGFATGRDTATREKAFDDLLAARESVLSWINEYSPYALSTPDDPPIYLYYENRPGLGQPQKDPTHTANFGVKLKERLDALGVPCELVHPGAADVIHPDIASYLIAALLAR